VQKACFGLVSLALLMASPAVLAQAKTAKDKEVNTIPVTSEAPADPSGMALSVRGSASQVTWDGNGGFTSDGGWGYGLGTGATFTWGPWFGDLGFDYYDVGQNTAPLNDFTRTDVLLTGGGKVTDWLTAFGGYRQAWQGDGVLNDDVWTESGLFIGGGVAFPIGTGDLRGGASLAYNLNKIDPTFPGSTEIDYNGLSGKVRVSLARTPHAVEMRFQTFKTDDPTLYLRESYLILAYVFNWKVLDF
jgi:hypothetical protein